MPKFFFGKKTQKIKKRDKISTNLFFVFSRGVVLRRHEKRHRERERERKEINDFRCSRDEYEQHRTEEDYDGGFEQRRRRVLEEEKANDDDDEKKTFYQSYENDEYDDDDDDGETTFKPPKQF